MPYLTSQSYAKTFSLINGEKNSRLIELNEKELKKLKTNLHAQQENLNEETKDTNEVASIYCRTR